MTTEEINGVLIIKIKSDLYFPAAEKLGDQIMLYQELFSSKNVVLDLTEVGSMDSAKDDKIRISTVFLKFLKNIVIILLQLVLNQSKVPFHRLLRY